MMAFALYVLAGLAAYALALGAAQGYGLKLGWESPDGAPGSAWTARRRAGTALGAVAVVVGAGLAWLAIDPWPARVATLGQAVLLAVAGASDVHRFQLPLPFTVAGLTLSLVSLSLSGAPPILMAFALFWALAMIVAHAWVSRGTMQLGDHLATVWIALAMPVNGLLAVLAGDAANLVVARARRGRAGKVAAAGPWLLAAAALVALPPYYAWFAPLPSARAPSARPMAGPVVAPDRARMTAALIQVSELAGEHAAAVALAEDREGRVAAALRASARVRQLAGLAAQLAPESNTAMGLADLARGLETYDVDGVRAASAALADERSRLLAALPGE